MSEEPLAVSREGVAWRREYALLIGMGFIITATAFAFFYFDVDLGELRRYGYVGVFIVNFIGAAALVLPMPGVAAVFGGGAWLSPVLGIPPPLLVALVAGTAEALGEFSGYAIGYGGRAMVEERPLYRRLEVWMRRHGTVTMFVMSLIPNPAFDVVGALAGAVHMPLWRFFLAVWAGKTLKGLYIAAGGAFSFGVFERLVG